MMGRLADVLETMWTQGWPPRPVPPQFKTPKYDSYGDVKYFIQQFLEVAETNGWDQVSSLRHLRGALN